MSYLLWWLCLPTHLEANCKGPPYMGTAAGMGSAQESKVGIGSEKLYGG